MMIFLTQIPKRTPESSHMEMAKTPGSCKQERWLAGWPLGLAFLSPRGSLGEEQVCATQVGLLLISLFSLGDLPVYRTALCTLAGGCPAGS